MENVLIIGRSFIGSYLYNSDRNFNYLLISHQDIDSVDFFKFDIVINTSLSPSYRNSKYDINDDIDIKIAEKANASGCYYVMISSRKVYGNFKQLKILKESDPYNPFDFYSENKAITEQYLLNNFNNVCVLRGSNFFGFELFRESFFGFCLTSLFEQNKIEFNLNQNIVRDFIHIDDVVYLINAVFEVKPKGVFNLGLNKGFAVKDIANNLIRGYGNGIFIGSDDFEYDQQFILDTSKLYTAIDFKPEYIDYENTIIGVGERLKF
jgi:nucleoside-diphosphate-sugar epimerase